MMRKYYRLSMIILIPFIFVGCFQTNNASKHQDQIAQMDLDSYLDVLAKAGFSGAILVAQKDQIQIKKGYGFANRSKQIPTTPETVFDSGSLSKQFTAAAILHLKDQEKLQTEATLSDFFADVPQEMAPITIHQLLTHSSGFPQYVYEGDFEETNRQKAKELAFAAELENEPGTEYLYSDTGYGLLAIIVERVSGQPFQDYLQQHLFQPIGMHSTGFYNDPKWNNRTVAHGYHSGIDFGSAATRPGPFWGILGFGGVLTTVDDLFLWNRALRQHRVLSKESTNKLFTPYISEGIGSETYYGYGWVIQDLPKYGRLAWHDGATDSHNAIMLMYDDPDETVIVVLSNKIEGGWFDEVFYATETGMALGNRVVLQERETLPQYVH